MCSKGVRGLKMTRQCHASCASQKHLYSKVGQVLNKPQILARQLYYLHIGPWVGGTDILCQTKFLVSSLDLRTV